MSWTRSKARDAKRAHTASHEAMEKPAAPRKKKHRKAMAEGAMMKDSTAMMKTPQ
ncbi:hypothetical protein BH11GEM1_BH11GEM1_03660 [soil metagenome]